MLTGVADGTGKPKGSFVILCGSDSSSTEWWPQSSPHHGVARLKLEVGPVLMPYKQTFGLTRVCEDCQRAATFTPTLSHNLAVTESSPESLGLETVKNGLSHISDQKWA